MRYFTETRKLTAANTNVEMKAVNVFPNLEKQTLLGFGGAFTEAAAYNYSHLTPEAKKEFLRKYFDKKNGAGYTVGRVHIGSCDFALDLYSEAYQPDLSDFNIEQDKKYVIPMLKDALAILGDSLFLFASPWSPPAFMKDSGALIGGGKLKPEYYGTYALYFVKFIQAYAKEGIRISAVTVQNEPHAVQTWESCCYSAEEEAEFAVKFLRPTLDANGLSDVKIIIWDHNRERVVERAQDSFAVEGATDAIWGMGFHWYSGEHYDVLDLFRSMYPEKPIFETELCHESSETFDDDSRNLQYAKEYVSCLRHGAAGICDWNLMLDAENGGPFHCRTTGGCAAPMYCDLKTGKLIVDGIYGAISTVSREIDPGDRVVATTSASADICEAAVKKADGSLVLFLLNSANEEREVNLRVCGKTASFVLPPMSLSANRLVD